MLLKIVILACAAGSTFGQCPTFTNRNPATLDNLRRSQLDFSINLFKAVGQAQKEENIFISPLSIYNALLLAYFTASGHTEESLRNALLMPKSQDKYNLMFAYGVQRYQSSSGSSKSQVHTSNRLFVSKKQTVLDCIKDIFDDEIQTVDFENDLQNTVKLINDWVANVTRNNIKDLVSTESVNPNSQLVLANAAYFKGIWQNMFDEQDTRTSEFHINKNKSTMAPMMFQQNTFGYYRSNELSAEVLELPYKDGEISMLLVLPEQSNETNPAAAILQRMDSNSFLNFIKGSTDSKSQDKFEVRIPRFMTERTLELSPILESLGVGDLFQSTADLSGLTGGPRIQLNNAIHKAKIQVDEHGTEAAAATAFTDTRIPANSFYCDRPFLYFLYNKPRELLLFAGLMYDPSK